MKLLWLRSTLLLALIVALAVSTRSVLADPETESVVGDDGGENGGEDGEDEQPREEEPVLESVLELEPLACGEDGFDPWAQRYLTRYRDAQSFRGQEPPKAMPEKLKPYFTRCGTVPTAEYYVDDTDGGDSTYYNFPAEDVNGLLDIAKDMLADDPKKINRDDRPLFQALQAFDIKDKNVVILGSMQPWIEVICVAHGAAKVTTIEYNRIIYEHDKLVTMRPHEVTEEMYGSFDVALSISAFDHDGLGRYGDPISPDADFRAMDELRRLVKPGGLLFLALPVGPDLVVWNLRRRYGEKRLPLMLQHWTLLARVGWVPERLTRQANFRLHNQPLFVLKNEEPPANYDVMAELNRSSKPKTKQPQQQPKTEL